MLSVLIHDRQSMSAVVRSSMVSRNHYRPIHAGWFPDASGIVELLGYLRAVAAPRHVRMETPFFSGPRTDLHLLVSGLP